jgi:hypothetical protein
MSSNNHKSPGYYKSLLLETIKKDNLTTFIETLKEEHNNYERKLSEELNRNGNTILHEAVYWNSSNILIFLLKNINKCVINKKNSDDNNILNLATLKQLDWVVDNIITTNYSNEICSSYNSHGDSPFLSAIRTGSQTLVNLYLINVHTSQHIKDKNQNNYYNSLHIAVTTSNKNFKIIKLLIENYKENYQNDIKSYLIGIPQNPNVSTTSIYSTFTPSTTSKISILEDLNKQPKNSVNLQIQTYIIRELYTSCLGNEVELKDILTDYPEYAAYEKCNNDNFNISMSFDENVKDTYRNTKQNSMKILPKTLKHSFSK